MTSDTTTRAIGVALSLIYVMLIGWLYARQPQTIAEVAGGLSDVMGVYDIDRRSFDDGLSFFRREQFVEARAAFHRADPAVRDARTQFYIAYSFYRQGWGRFYEDDALFRQGLEAADRAIALAPHGRLVVDDPDLRLRTADELRAALESGLHVEPSDFSPARVLRERK
jgi:hypothetical protein